MNRHAPKPHLIIAMAIALIIGLVCHGQSLTPRAATIKKTAGATMNLAPHIPGHVIVLVWKPAYDGATNVETVVESKSDLVLPADQWTEVFHGQTNTASFPATNARAYYRAKTRFIFNK